ncbi:Leucine aminopeptidase [gamma proteobacterium HdN1]|nr:Leucine aminopeptidase [gamma proteobacterium HdN1]
MDFSVKLSSPESLKTGCLVVPVTEGGKLGALGAQLDGACNGGIKALLALGDITGKAGDAGVYGAPEGMKAQRLLLLGVGNTEGLDEAGARKALQKAYATAKTTKTADLAFLLEDFPLKGLDLAWLVQRACESGAGATYVFNDFKGKDKQTTIALAKTLFVVSEKPLQKALNEAARVGQAIANAMDRAKTLGNLPANVCTPTYIAEEAQKLADSHEKIQLTVLEEKDMRKLGMNSFLSVSAGSHQPAKLVLLEYKGGKAGSAPHVLVGKGITFDTGGISLKPGPDMDQMKFDMCGAATVFATMQAVAELNLPLNVSAALACAENMPSGTATRPGDIVTTLSGQTVEILNTDAEGRLVLCDTLTYVERLKPASVIDVATLTGACVIALGNEVAGMWSNNDALADRLKAAAQTSQDKIWQMPLWDEYQKMLDSPFADMANIGGRAAGSNTAAAFLARFTKQYEWAHLDIAGIAWVSSGPEKGASGRPVPLLTQYLLDRCK